MMKVLICDINLTYCFESFGWMDPGIIKRPQFQGNKDAVKR